MTQIKADTKREASLQMRLEMERNITMKLCNHIVDLNRTISKLTADKGRVVEGLEYVTGKLRTAEREVRRLKCNSYKAQFKGDRK